MKHPLFYISRFTCPYRFSSPPIAFQTNALTAAPTNGATMKSHNCDNARPPSNKAGPMLRAGLTDVPVIGMQTMCTNTNVRPMQHH